MTATVFGKTVNGEISQTNKPAAQADPQLLNDALTAFFKVDSDALLRWEQYTPYFNDGDVCEFGIREALVKLPGVEDPRFDGYEGFVDSWDVDYAVKEGDARFLAVPNIDGIVAALDVVSRELSNGSHYDFLRQHFGDPARVTASAEGFDVEYYEHD